MAMNNKILCGYAQSDITPAMPLYLDGFAARSGKSTGIRDTLYIKALYFEDARGECCIMLVVDMIGFGYELSRRIKSAATEVSGIPDERVMLLATHTHSGPAAGVLYGLPKCDEYWDEVILKVKVTVKAATEAKFEVGLSLDEYPISLGINRRQIVEGKVVIGKNPDKPCDNNMRVLRFIDGEKTVGVLCNASCHPVNHGAENMRITADYPSKLHSYANGKDNFFAVYTNSACGNINPLRPYGDDAEANLNACGDELVRVIEEALASEYCIASDNADITCLYDTVKLPIELKFDLETAKDKYGYWMRKLETETDENVLYRAKVYANWYGLQIEALEKGEKPSLDIQIRLFSLGEVAIVSLPFELFCETRARLCEAFERITGKKLIVCGYADHLRSYLPDALALSEGGYETESACVWYAIPGKYTPDSESTLLSACERQFMRLLEKENE